MKAYTHNNDGYYNGIIFVQKSPKGENYLMPQNATLLEPQFKSGTKCKFDGAQWINEPIDYAEIEAIAQAQARTNALSRQKFTKLEIRRALRSLNQEDILDALLNGNATFKSDWLDAQEIDLSDALTIQALQSVEIDIEQVKLKIAGVS